MTAFTGFLGNPSNREKANADLVSSHPPSCDFCLCSLLAFLKLWLGHCLRFPDEIVTLEREIFNPLLVEVMMNS